MARAPFELIPTCWTSAGDAAPLRPSEESPYDIGERVRAAADAGFAGIGIAQDDLRVVRDGIGFAALRETIAASGLRYTEVELLTDWWLAEPEGDVRSLLLDAAKTLGATHIKIASAFGEVIDRIDPLVSPLRDLADEAADAGVRIALEPMPFGAVSSVPMAADLVRATDRPNCGIVIDSWHVFRANTALADLRASLSADIVFGVELNDAAEQVRGTLVEDTIDHRLPCGSGCFDLRGLIRTVADIGWSGPWGVEIISKEFRRLDLATALRRAFDTTQSALADALG